MRNTVRVNRSRAEADALWYGNLKARIEKEDAGKKPVTKAKIIILAEYMKEDQQ